MRRGLITLILSLCLLIAVAPPISSQVDSRTAFRIRPGASLPATCNPNVGDVFFLTAGSIGLYECTATDTWTYIGAGITGSGANTRVTFWDGASSLSSDADFTFTGGNTVTSPLGVFGTSISSPSLISTGAIGITPASGSNLNVTLATTGDLVVNTDDLYVDTSTGNIGVSNTSPDVMLTVSNNSRAATAIGQSVLKIGGQIATTNVNEVGFGGDDSTATPMSSIGNIVVDGASFGKGAIYFATRDVTTNTVPTERMRITNTGSVGIGASPSYLLDVRGVSAVTGANGQATQSALATNTVAAATAATLTISNLIPAASLVKGVSCRVTTTFDDGSGLTTFSIGDGSDADRWGAAITRTSGTTTNIASFTITSPVYYAAAANIVLTADAGTFNVAAGAARCTVHYETITAATS